MLFDFLQNFIKCHLREYVTFLTKSWGVFVAALGNVGVPGALPRTFVTPSRAVFPQWSSRHVCSGSIRGSDMEGCWGAPAVATRKGWARGSAQGARHPASALQRGPGRSWATAEGPGTSTSLVDVLSFSGRGLASTSRCRLPEGAAGTGPAGGSSQRGGRSLWKAGDRGGEVWAGLAVQEASASGTRFRALRQTLCRRYDKVFIVQLLQNRGQQKAGSRP